MSVQSTYTRYQPKAQAGMPANTVGWDADSRTADGNIPFGYAVSKGALEDGVIVGGTLFAGVAVRDVTLVHTTVDRYEQYDDVAVLVRGDIWVVVEEAVVAKTVAKYDTSTGQLGKAAGTAISGSVWMTSADAAGLAILRLGNTAGDLTT